MEKDAFYFPHFSNARNDRKLRRVRKELGMEGYGIYFAVLEVLRDQNEFKYPLDDIDLLADDFNTSEQKVRAVITIYGLFQNDDEDFFSLKFNEYLSPYIAGKERKRIAALKGNLIRHKHVSKQKADDMTDFEIIDLTEVVRNARNARPLLGHNTSTASQRKGKERKGKEKKGNNNKEVENAKSVDFSDTLPNNISKSKNEIPIVLKTTPAPVETRNAEYTDFVKAFYGRVKKRSPNLIITDAKKTNGANEFRLMHERDKRTMDEIKKVIITVFKDDFWSDVIKTPKGLRKTYNDGLFDKILREGPKNGDKPKQVPHTKPKLWIKPKDVEPDASTEEIGDILSDLVRKFK